MKKLSLIFALLMIAAFSFGQLATSGHDFSDGAGFNLDAWNTAATNKICGPCHTPHNALTTVPLWSHTNTVAAHTPYPGNPAGTMDAVVGAPAGVSLVCLSCHDGTVALDNFIPVSTTTTMIAGTPLVGTDLSNDHPISFTYNTALATADGELKDPSVALSGLGGTIAADMLFTNQMECASCHDVHNTAGLDPLMLMDNTNSELCLTCHTK